MEQCHVITRCNRSLRYGESEVGDMVGLGITIPCATDRAPAEATGKLVISLGCSKFTLYRRNIKK
jgi:hypothetical protein